MKKRNVVTQKPIMKTKTVVILIVILIISAILGIYKFCRDYQKEQENIPELYFYDAYGTETKLIPVEYSWEYKGNVSNYKDENYLKKDYSMQVPAYINCNLEIGKEKEYITSKEKYKINEIYREEYLYKNGEYQNVSGGTAITDFKDKSKIQAGASSSTEGDFLIKYYVQYKKQGYVTYIFKANKLNSNCISASKSFENLKLENKESIEKLVKQLRFNSLVKSVNVENNNLILEYEYYINDDLITNNAILFSCINDLENIVYTATNKKTIYYNEETKQSEKKELGEKIVNRQSFQQKNNINFQYIKNFINEI